MKFGVIRQPTSDLARSPFRIIERTTNHEVEWVNHFLDRECLRRVTHTTLYSYAYHLYSYAYHWLHLFAGGKVCTIPMRSRKARSRNLPSKDELATPA